MTLEEAKKVFINRGFIEVEGGIIFDGDKWRESCVVISRWFEQEPCEDVISRESALKCFEFPNTRKSDFIAAIKQLPSVRPKEQSEREE